MRRRATVGTAALCLILLTASTAAGQEWWKPYSPPCTERENVFAFTQKPAVKLVGKDKYEITFAVKGYCDVTVGIVDAKGKVVRHLGSGVLGSNAPLPFQKGRLKQTLYWNGKDDLDAYCKEPGTLQVRVMLGLKPTFDKRLGGTSPKNLPGGVSGMAIGPDGAIIICAGLTGFGHATIRKFDHDGNYVQTVFPPPADLPDRRLGGMGSVAYAPGQRAVHSPTVNRTVAYGTHFFRPLDANHLVTVQPAIAGDRFVFTNPGAYHGWADSRLHYLHSDGGTDVLGVDGVILSDGLKHKNPRLAASPDGKTIYISNVTGLGSHGQDSVCAVFARSLDTDKDKPGRVFAGALKKPGADNAHLNGPLGIDCDKQGRVYVADSRNNRIQVFSSNGTYLKTIKIDRPDLIAVHKKSGAIYVTHEARVRGRTTTRVTKLISFSDPTEAFHMDGMTGMMALDSWSTSPRLWFSGTMTRRGGHSDSIRALMVGSGSVTLWEERGKAFVKIVDFEEDAKKEAGKTWWGRWNGEGSHTLPPLSGRTVCDPTRGKLYYKEFVFDLATGNVIGRWTTGSPCFEDVQFDKRGFMHGHQNNRARMPCVWRVDPERAATQNKRSRQAGGVVAYSVYKECPYDQGVAVKQGNWTGALATKGQGGAKGFQDGMGVNMRGDVVVESNIYYVPRMDDVGHSYAMAGADARRAEAGYSEEHIAYAAFTRAIKDRLKKGEEVYSIRRKPGTPLVGATIWVYDATGELRTQAPAVPGGLLSGAQIDEDGFVYFVLNGTRRFQGKPFLAGKGGRFGLPTDRAISPFTGTYVKVKPERLRVLLSNAPIPMDAPPKREADLKGGGGMGTADKVWVDGAEWLYAGASPLVPLQPCSCPQMRAHLDWYKRSYVPEQYRYSIAILDTNGNIIMRIGRYGNFDTAPGSPKGAKPGGTDFGITSARYLSGTDDYLCFEDWGERLVVLKLTYHAEETVPLSIPAKAGRE